MPASFTTFKGDINALGNDILIVDMEKGEKVSSGGIIVMDDNGENRGIRPRWAKVYKMGDKAKSTVDVNVGDWILIEHGRWTFGFNVELPNGEEIYVQKVELKSIMMVSDTCPLV